MTTQLDRPMKPDELGIVQENALPGVVFNAINKLIAANWTGNAARVLQKDIVTGIIQEWRNQGQPGFYPVISRDDVYDRHYLDFEEAYRGTRLEGEI